VPARLLATLGSNVYLIYIPSRKAITKTSFIKVIEAISPIKEGLTLKNPLRDSLLEGEEGTIVPIRDKRASLSRASEPIEPSTASPIEPTLSNPPAAMPPTIAPPAVALPTPTPIEALASIEPAEDLELIDLSAIAYLASAEIAYKAKVQALDEPNN
jgi:hypothetical protein